MGLLCVCVGGGSWVLCVCGGGGGALVDMCVCVGGEGGGYIGLYTCTCTCEGGRSA